MREVHIRGINGLCEYGIGLQFLELRPGETDVYLQCGGLCKFIQYISVRRLGLRLATLETQTYRLSGHAR